MLAAGCVAPRHYSRPRDGDQAREVHAVGAADGLAGLSPLAERSTETVLPRGGTIPPVERPERTLVASR